MSVIRLNKDHPVLLITTSSGHNPITQEYVAFLGQHWSPGVETWPDTPNRLAAAIVLYQGEDLKNGQIQYLRLLINWRVPVLIINTNGHHSRSWTDLAARNNRVKYAAADDEAWHDVFFHFLASLSQSLKADDFSLLATSLPEREQRQAQTASV